MGTKVPYVFMDREHIIKAIEAFSERSGLAPATITGRAVGNSRLYQRMKDGGDCTTEIGKRIIAFIEVPASQAGAV